ncbi:hypothetical protein [Saccharopolyspora pogona]|uniref:hypothetical protein n=1 Tax=Saccharopolyspora pogona TaxID=333966 RepID=UPI0016862F1B|nr:hypothetical protein [Saccharopolyspora pogona]
MISSAPPSTSAHIEGAESRFGALDPADGGGIGHVQRRHVVRPEGTDRRRGRAGRRGGIVPVLRQLAQIDVRAAVNVPAEQIDNPTKVHLERANQRILVGIHLKASS